MMLQDKNARDTARDDQIFDANKPMLLNMIRAWGFDAVDGGHFMDDPDLIRDGFNKAAQIPFKED